VETGLCTYEQGAKYSSGQPRAQRLCRQRGRLT